LKGWSAGSQCRIGAIDRLRKRQVRHRVFMRAEHQRLVRQLRQLRQRCSHLRRRAFEQAPTAGAKQRVAAEQPVRARVTSHVGNVPQRMPRHVQHVERQTDARHGDAIALHQRVGDKIDAIVLRAEHGHIPFGQQGGHATDMVSMMMGE
jgi:hypothetical protein